MNIYNLYCMNKENTGDMASSPLNYVNLNEYGKVKTIDIREENKIEKDSIVIIGGGGLINYNDDWNRKLKEMEEKATTIYWGAGNNTHFDNAKIKYHEPKGKLVGMRDSINQFVPCSSCLHEIFEKENNEIKRELGVIFHKERKELKEMAKLSKIEKIENSQPIEEIIKFIDSTKIIITNTYHGAYWTMLRNKRPYIYRPFSSRFARMPALPATILTFDMNNLKEEKVNVYNKCKKANNEFIIKVKKVLEK